MAQSVRQDNKRMEEPTSVGGDARPSALRLQRVPRAGEPAPWFHAPTPENPNFSFDTVGGRRVVLCFFGDLHELALRRLLGLMREAEPRLASVGAVVFGVSTLPGEAHAKLLKEVLPHAHLFLDRGRSISRLYGVASADGAGQEVYRPVSFVLDERLRVVDVVTLDDDVQAHVQRILRVLEPLPAREPERIAGGQAPVLVVPRVFEPRLCQALINYYERMGGERSGFMRDVGGRTVLAYDERHKRRRDRTVEDVQLRDACMHRIHDRLVPEIAKAFQFRATRIERYIVACYEAEDAGHFRAHRDNTTRGTAHRRFAVSLNLNTGEYQGGQLRFPEFGNALHQPPAGGAVVFSCSLLHEATSVTEGKRYAFLPFVYDEAAASVRERNKEFCD